MKRKFMAITKEQLNELPEDVQSEVLSTLKAYDECDIVYESGKYKVGSCMLKSNYAPDYKFIGVAYVDDIYTLEERTQNYIEVFHDYPHWYKGNRDYEALSKQYGEPPIFD